MTLGALTVNLKNHGFREVSGPHADILDSLTHGGPRVLGAQFFEQGTRQRCSHDCASGLFGGCRQIFRRKVHWSPRYRRNT